jgi:hypothetical protein
VDEKKPKNEPKLKRGKIYFYSMKRKVKKKKRGRER